jgi:osmotically-inducible protein OsmY
MTNDAQVQLNVRAQLGWEPLLGAAHIGVSVTDGVVALTGCVGSCPERWAAERAAERVAGVNAVTSDLDVALPDSSRHSDTHIARSAQDILRWMTSLPLDCVRVVVDSGWITLSGRVVWDYQRQAAAAAVRYVVGAAGVTDLIAVDGGTSSPEHPREASTR